MRHPSGEPIQFLAVGHVSVDRVDGVRRVGGAATYAALAAQHLGCKVGLVTSAGPDFPYWDTFGAIAVRNVPASQTTEFENTYESGARRQRVRQVAATINPNHLAGLDLAQDAAVLYCPIVHEIGAPFVALAPRGLCGVTPQGFFRQWDDRGHVFFAEWPDADKALSRVHVVCMSEEDAPVPEELAERFKGTAFVITRGEKGCRIYAGLDEYNFPAVPARVVDPTGAGDVFAAAFLVALRARKALPQAAHLAARAASMAVETKGVGAFS